MAKKPNLTLVHGFVHARAVGIDESDGEERTVPGRFVRMRTAHISAYSQAEPGVLAVWMIGCPGEDGGPPFEIMGTVAEMDKVMARSSVRNIADDGVRDA